MRADLIDSAIARTPVPVLPGEVGAASAGGRPEALSQHASAVRRRDFIWIVGAAVVFYGLNVDFLISGDSAMYADYVLQAKFNELTLHIGYYAVAYALHHTLGALLGIPIQETIVWLNVASGALALGVMYRLALHFLPTRREALLCVALLAVCGRVINNATTSEIYMLQTLLVTWSFLLFVEEHVVAAGLAAGAALLVSPLSVFAYLFFPVYDLQRAGRIRWRVLFRLAAAALVLYLPYLAVFGRELLWGTRGLLKIDRIARFEPLTMLVNVPRYQFKHYTALLVLTLPALLAVRSNKRFLLLTLAVVVPHLYIASKLTGEDNVFLLSTDFFFACWLVIGWRELARLTGGRQIAWTLVATHLALLVASRQIFAFDSHRGYGAEMKAIARQYLVGRDATMITDWTASNVLTFYGRPAVVSTIARDPLFRQMYDIENSSFMNPRLLEARELYLLETWRPGPLRRLLTSRAAIARSAQEYSVGGRSAHLGLSCTILPSKTHPLYRCFRAPAARPGQVS